MGQDVQTAVPKNSPINDPKLLMHARPDMESHSGTPQAPFNICIIVT
jgi:hypothetical protein